MEYESYHLASPKYSGGYSMPKDEIVCLSCLNTYHSEDATVCKNCYEKVGETEKRLKSQIEDLSSTVSFFRSSFGNPLVSPPPFSDVVLVASDDSTQRPPIPANRTVLAGHSPVFRAMLENKMDESISGTIKIGEVSYDTLGLFVSFLYTAEATNLDEKTARDLLVLGEKYQVPHLKTYCEKILISNLNWENSLPLYAFARQYNAHSLLSESLSLILKNMRRVPRRQDYAQLVEKDPRMLLQIHEAYLRWHY